ncbi:NUDIX domain-containing protein [Faucicola boevrei]|uniref:NUDIX domain-containing protein n=1 Tax=Faucicola boevrei TaxID=346665 RepID=UPI000370FF0A|nr:NUDIX domain-containing protein [Moraxella boevrei]
MLQGLAKAKALKELQMLVKDKASLKGLALAKALKRQNELRSDLGMGKITPANTNPRQEYADTLLFNKSGQILLAQRSAKDDFKPNKWWIVGGKIEQGETPKQGAIRELAEETDVKLSDLTFVEKVNLSTGSISHRFAGVVKDDTPIHLKKDELQAYAWVNTDKLGEYELLGTLGDLQKLVENGFDLIKFEFVPSGKTPLDPNEIQPLHIDDPSKTKKAVETYLKQFKDKYITTVDGKNVVFNSKGRNHLANDVVFGDEMVAQVIEKVAEILTQGKFIERQPLTKVRTKDDYVAFHKYRKWVLIDNAEIHLQVKVAELTDGSFEMGNGLIAYSAKNAEYEDEKKATTPPVSPSFDGLLINSGDCRLLNNNTAFDKVSQEYNQIGNLTDEYIFIEILEVRPLGATNIKNQAPFDRTHIAIPRTKTTRQKANNEAFAILDKLDNGEITPTDLTDDDKQILAKYSGNGGALKGRDGKTGSDYEYYTPKELATGMWDLAKELGFNGGRVLDPCCGTGVFTATSPDNVLMDNIELDETSGKISQLLNDGNRSTTTISPFEKIVNSYDDGDDDNGFDMVITNVPFGDNSARGANKLHDTAYQDASLDYYFIMRTLEKLKSGGLAVLMTAPSTITGKGAKQIELRQKTSRIAEFLGAYRLPNSMFTDTGADVSVDVMVFKKYNTQMIETINNHYENGNIELLQQAGVLWDDYLSGHYFVHHKKNVLGTEVQAKNRFGDDIVKVQSDLSQAEIAKLFRKFDSRINWELLNTTPAEITYKDGDVVYRGGVQYMMQDGLWQSQTTESNDDDDILYQDMLSKLDKSMRIIEHGIGYDDVVAMTNYFAKKSINSQSLNDVKTLLKKVKNDTEWQIYHTSQAINDVLAKHGLEFSYRTEYPLLTEKMRDVVVLAKGGYQGIISVALKNIKLHYNKGNYSDVWNGNIQTAVEQDLNIVGSLSSKIAQLQYNNKSKYISLDNFKQIAPEIDVMADDDYFIASDGQSVIQASDFLVGNLQERLDDLDKQIAEAVSDEIKLKLIRQRAKAISDLPVIDIRKITYGLRNPLIPAEFKAQFLRTVTSMTVDVVQNDSGRDVVSIDGKTVSNQDKIARRIGLALEKDQRLTLGGMKIDGLDEKQALELLNKTFNEWNVQFNAWVKANDRLMQLLENKVNDPKNRYFTQNDDESSIDIHGLASHIKLHGYQNAFVRNQGRLFGGINGFGVGLGKTLSALASVQHAHNIGLKKKTLFVVPKSVLSNWRKEVMNAYSNTDDCIFIGLRENGENFTVKSSLFDEDLLKCISGQYRKIFLTFEALQRIKLREKTVDSYINSLTASDNLYQGANSESKKESERAKGVLAILKKELTYNGNAPFLEDMGVDSLVIDEAHAFKNSAQAKTAGRTKYLSSPNSSSRGTDAQAKAWYIRGLSVNNDGVQMLTATPVTNSPLEVYSMLSLAVGREQTNRMLGGINGADDFIQSTCVITNEIIDKIDGTTGNADVFMGLTNINMLKSAINQVTTVKNAEDIKGMSVVIPERESVSIGVKLSGSSIQELKTLQKAYMSAKSFLKSGNKSDLTAEYSAIKAKFNESDELLAHPFNLIRKMEVLISDDDFSDNCTFYDIDENQLNLVKKSIDEFNKKPPKDTRTRLSSYTQSENVQEKYDDDGSIKEYEVVVNADVIVHKGRNRIMLDSMDYHIQQRFEGICEKMGVKLDVTISAKISALLENIKAEMTNKRGKRKDGTTSNIVKQIIFCDHLHLHSKIVRLLVDKCGIAKQKIAIITGQVNSEADEIIDVQNGFNAMDDENVYQIVLANKKAEVGINLQIGTQAIHHLTTGWTPDSLEQRNGRGARQGNHTESVKIYYYDADGTFDSFKREMINKKDEWISDLLQGDKQVIEVAGELSKDDQNALIESIGDEDAIQKYLAQRDEAEKQHRLDMAKLDQRINMNTIVAQQDVLKKTYQSEVEALIKKYLTDKPAKQLVQQGVINKKDGSVTPILQFNGKQKEAFNVFKEGLEKVLDLFDLGRSAFISTDIDELAMHLINDNAYSLGTTKKLGLGSGGYDYVATIIRSLVGGYDNYSLVKGDRRTSDLLDKNTEFYDEFMHRQEMAQKLIDQSIQAIDEVAQTQGGYPIGSGQKIADKTAVVVGNVFLEIGDILISNDNGRIYVVTNTDIGKAWGKGIYKNGERVFSTSEVLNAYEVSDKYGAIEEQAISNFTLIQQNDNRYLDLLKQMAEFEDTWSVEHNQPIDTYSSILSQVVEFKNKALSYSVSAPHNYYVEAFDFSFGYLLGGSWLKNDTPFMQWYHQELQKNNISYDKDTEKYNLPISINKTAKTWVSVTSGFISTLIAVSKANQLALEESDVKKIFQLLGANTFDFVREVLDLQGFEAQIASLKSDIIAGKVQSDGSFNWAYQEVLAIAEKNLKVKVHLKGYGLFNNATLLNYVEEVQDVKHGEIQKPSSADILVSLEEIDGDTILVFYSGSEKLLDYKDDIKDYAVKHGDKVFAFKGRKIPYAYNAQDNHSWSVQSKVIKKLIDAKPSFKKAIETKAITFKVKS